MKWRTILVLGQTSCNHQRELAVWHGRSYSPCSHTNKQHAACLQWTAAWRLHSLYEKLVRNFDCSNMISYITIWITCLWLVQCASCDVKKINNVVKFCQCSVMFSENMASRDPCFRGTWCKLRDTMHLHRFFGPTAVLDRSICILCCCVMDNDTNLLHLFRDITEQILTVNLDQHWKIM